MTRTEDQVLASSFRDPDGVLFERGGVLYRQVNHSGAAGYDLMMNSGLYQKLVKAGQLIPHQEVEIEPLDPVRVHKILHPEPVPFISYPYEWSFSQLKDAALTTLSIQKKALAAGMILKDASAYNIQFLRGKPVLIDTLSFDPYQDGQIWDGYRQFCQHFLAPLALMAHVDIRLSQLLRIHLDGIPLDLAARLLGSKSWLKPGLFVHLSLHARAQRAYQDPAKTQSQPRGSLRKEGLLGLVDDLRNTIKKLTWTPAGTEWGDYYNQTNYSSRAFDHKSQIISGWIEQINPQVVWDLGANNGAFSRIASQRGCRTLAFDIDPAAVEHNYLHVRQTKEENLLPLLQDLTNPSPAVGWANQERGSLAARGPADLLFSLALIHHLALSNNTPLERIAAWFSTLGKSLIIEFVPKSDSQVQLLLASREDIFPDFTREGFEAAFSTYWEIVETVQVVESDRILYRMTAKPA